MPQSQLFAETDETTAKSLMAVLDTAFEDDGFPVSAFEDPANPNQWQIAVYCETDLADETSARILELSAGLGLKIAVQREDISDDTDWVAATLRDLSAVRAGRYIVHGTHEKHVPVPHEISVLIDAGLAFGTGHHGTTAGCLDMMTKVYKRRKYSKVLDLGTGSGVLAIAAAKTAPCAVLATDIDPVATETAHFNTHRNGVHQSVECITATGFNHRRFAEEGPFDLVIANILAKPLMSMAHDLVNHTAQCGTVILSGLLPHQRRPLVATFRLQGLHLEHYHIRDNWLTLLFQKG
ncbi:MAG: 50S ribosomal protein L11 methyltransferase [Pseudomonadota bacterium]